MQQRPKFVYEDGYFVLAEDWNYVLSDDGKERKSIHLKKGEFTNFGSIPWYVRWAVSPIDPDIVIPATIHDALVNEFEDGETVGIYIENLLTGECEIDYPDWDKSASICRAIMDKEGSPTWKKQVVYLGIRLNGILKGKK